MIWKKLIDFGNHSWKIQVWKLNPCDTEKLVISETSLSRYMKASLPNHPNHPFGFNSSNPDQTRYQFKASSIPVQNLFNTSAKPVPLDCGWSLLNEVLLVSNHLVTQHSQGIPKARQLWPEACQSPVACVKETFCTTGHIFGETVEFLD